MDYAVNARASYGGSGTESVQVLLKTPFYDVVSRASRENAAVIALDETQAAYGLGASHTLWDAITTSIKRAMEKKFDRGLFFVVFAAYGDSHAASELTTPITFPITLSLADLRLHQTECCDMFTRLKEVCRARCILDKDMCLAERT